MLSDFQNQCIRIADNLRGLISARPGDLTPKQREELEELVADKKLKKVKNKNGHESYVSCKKVVDKR